MHLYNWKIGARLALGFGTLMALVLLTAFNGASRMAHINQATEQLAQDRFPKLNWTKALDQQVSEIGKAGYGLMLAPDAAFAGKQKSEIDAARKEMAQNLEKLDAKVRSAKGREILTALKAAQAVFLASVDEVIKLHADGKTQEALDLMMKGMRDARYALKARIEELIKYQSEMVEAGVVDAESAYKGGLALLIGLSLLGALIAFGVSWWATRSVTVPIRQAVQVADSLAKGDLTQQIEVQRRDETGQLLASLAHTVAQLRGIVGGIKEATESISTGTGQIASGNADLSQRTEEQASSLEETASSMEELTSTVKQNAENARQANQLAIGASEVARKGGEVVGRVVETMSSINESSKKIVDIISVIDGIAFQTNILALNAAVEAARAGEQGRGFAVVATEVRNLAQRSAAAAKEIKALISDSVEKVASGTELVDGAGKTMEEIVTAVKRVNDIMSEITAASHEQSAGIEQINKAVAQMDEVTQQNASLVEEAAAAAESLEEQARTLSGAVAAFQLGTAAERPVAQVAQVVDLAAAKSRRRNEKPVAPKLDAPRLKAAAGGAEGWEAF